MIIEEIMKIKALSIHHIKLKGLGIYFFITVIIYLAGSYFGGILLFLFYCFMLLPFFSLILLLFTIKGVRFSQYFSNDHPIKGETIRYRVVISNESLFSVSEISSTFVTIHPLTAMMIPDFRLSLKRGERKEFTYMITCSYRGIYQVGLDAVHITDVMNFITILSLIHI